jgi:nitroimidazol reductase NimA-like FMN-containing flavoprotein (pyridoxamine 5'-phosphate oxidase superfamily)
MRDQRIRGSDELSQAECLTLLAGHRLGRLAFTDRALPTIRPLRYSLLGAKVLLRVDLEGLRSQLDGQVVAFAVDELDEESGAGWSVVITGPVRVVQPSGELLHMESADAVTGPHIRVCLLQGEIEGRRYEAAT